MLEGHGSLEVVGRQDCLLLTSEDQHNAPPLPGGRHVPVLLSEMLAALQVRSGGAYLDATFGGGGYSRAILQAGAGRLFAIDRDPAAAARGRELAAACSRFFMLEGRFGDMAELLAAHGVRRLDGVVLDLGVSSMQLDEAGRGFSFAGDGPLDMRMSGVGMSAADVVNRADADTLADLLWRYGEEPAARRIARAIVERAAAAPDHPHARAGRAGGRRGRPQGRPHRPGDPDLPGAAHCTSTTSSTSSSARCQAAEGLLVPGGRLVVVAFHSLEDRIVKRFLAERSGVSPRPSRHVPIGAAPSEAPRWRLLARRPVRPGPAEIAANPRARSARLRWAERAGQPEPTP